MSPIVLTVPEARQWFAAAVIALVAPADRDRLAWVFEAIRVLDEPLNRRLVALDNERAAEVQWSKPPSNHGRDARILCFLAAVLRAVDAGERGAR